MCRACESTIPFVLCSVVLGVLSVGIGPGKSEVLVVYVSFTLDTMNSAA